MHGIVAAVLILIIIVTVAATTTYACARTSTLSRVEKLQGVLNNLHMRDSVNYDTHAEIRELTEQLNTARVRIHQVDPAAADYMRRMNDINKFLNSVALRMRVRL